MTKELTVITNEAAENTNENTLAKISIPQQYYGHNLRGDNKFGERTPDELVQYLSEIFEYGFNELADRDIRNMPVILKWAFDILNTIPENAGPTQMIETSQNTFFGIISNLSVTFVDPDTGNKSTMTHIDGMPISLLDIPDSFELVDQQACHRSADFWARSLVARYEADIPKNTFIESVRENRLLAAQSDAQNIPELIVETLPAGQESLPKLGVAA